MTSRHVARETTSLVTYLSPLKQKAYAAKIDFWTGFLKNLSFKIAISGRAGVGHRPRITIWLTFLKNPSIMPFGIFLVQRDLMCRKSNRKLQKLSVL